MVEGLIMRYAIKKQPLDFSIQINKERGEFEIEADNIDDARTKAKKIIDDPAICACIFAWSDKFNKYCNSSNKEYVNATTLYKYDGEKYEQHVSPFEMQYPGRGKFFNKEDARQDYLKYKLLADKELNFVEDQLNSLERKTGVRVDYYIDGDTHGIHEEYLYLEVTKGAYRFERIINHN